MPAEIVFSNEKKLTFLSSCKERSYIVYEGILYFFIGQTGQNLGEVVKLTPNGMCARSTISSDTLVEVVDIKIIVYRGSP